MQANRNPLFLIGGLNSQNRRADFQNTTGKIFERREEMETLEKINQLDIKINGLRLQLIGIISDINHMVKTNNARARSEEYAALKKKYFDTTAEIEGLNLQKKTLLDIRE